MKILIASDSFKDALPALEVCQAIEKGIQSINKNIETQLFPMADGGEGTASILTYHFKGHLREIEVRDPLFRPTKANYGLAADGQIAFIEMAAASGLQLLTQEERDVLKTSTIGTGELITDALNQGVKKIILGIGGSATNDVGMGMATALGYEFLDEKGNLVTPVGENLNKVITINDGDVNTLLGGIKVEVICDVDNPLFGQRGAAYVYARQKGANDSAIALLNDGMRHFTKVVKKEMNIDINEWGGAGAAGGLGAGAVAFLNAKLRRGIELVMELTQFEEALKTADLVITGEGKIDSQTLYGKLIHGITQKATQQNVPVIALCGKLEASTDQIKALGLAAAYSINSEPIDLAKALSMTAQNLRATAKDAVERWISNL